MKFNCYWIMVMSFIYFGCGSDEFDEPEKSKQISNEDPNPDVDDEATSRFVSSDRELSEIFSDYEKPLNYFPKIWQDEAVIQKNGRLYRENITDDPFTGSVVENFDDGTVSIQTSYYRGLPHGQQVKNYPSGQKALEVNFDQGVIIGTKSRWWPDGGLREEGYWSEGKYLGRRLWDQTGRLVKEEIVPQN